MARSRAARKLENFRRLYRPRGRMAAAVLLLARRPAAAPNDSVACRAERSNVRQPQSRSTARRDPCARVLLFARLIETANSHTSKAPTSAMVSPLTDASV